MKEDNLQQCTYMDVLEYVCVCAHMILKCLPTESISRFLFTRTSITIRAMYTKKAGAVFLQNLRRDLCPHSHGNDTYNPSDWNVKDAPLPTTSLPTGQSRSPLE